jgi:hypothetical protein
MIADTANLFLAIGAALTALTAAASLLLNLAQRRATRLSAEAAQRAAEAVKAEIVRQNSLAEVIRLEVVRQQTIAKETRDDVGKVHSLVNSQLTALKADLVIADKRIAELMHIVQTLKDKAKEG